MEAIVAHHLHQFENLLLDKTDSKQGKPDSVIEACVELYEADCKKKLPPASGFLAALVENPDLLNPARTFSRRLIDRIKSNASDVPTALVVFIALEGLRCLPLLDIDTLSDAERRKILDKLHSMVGQD